MSINEITRRYVINEVIFNLYVCITFLLRQYTLNSICRGQVVKYFLTSPSKWRRERSKHWLQNNVRNERTAGFPSRLICRTCVKITRIKELSRRPSPTHHLVVRARCGQFNGFSRIKINWTRGRDPTNMFWPTCDSLTIFLVRV